MSTHLAAANGSVDVMQQRWLWKTQRQRCCPRSERSSGAYSSHPRSTSFTKRRTPRASRPSSCCSGASPGSSCASTSLSRTPTSLCRCSRISSRCYAPSPGCRACTTRPTRTARNGSSLLLPSSTSAGSDWRSASACGSAPSTPTARTGKTSSSASWPPSSSASACSRPTGSFSTETDGSWALTSCSWRSTAPAQCSAWPACA